MCPMTDRLFTQMSMHTSVEGTPVGQGLRLGGRMCAKLISSWILLSIKSLVKNS